MNSEYFIFQLLLPCFFITREIVKKFLANIRRPMWAIIKVCGQLLTLQNELSIFKNLVKFYVRNI